MFMHTTKTTIVEIDITQIFFEVLNKPNFSQFQK